LPSKIIGRT